MNIRPLTLTAAAVIALSSPTMIASAAPAVAAERAGESSCDASSLHAFSRGHQDLALVGDSGNISFIARDDESGKDYDSGEFYVEVGSNAAFDESAGSDIPSSGWQIPQTQDPAIPWLGFNTSYLDPATAEGATLSLTLHSAPEGGRMVGFQNSLGAAPTVLFDSEDPDITWNYPDHFHSHTGIIFTEPGAYAATFTFTLNDGSEHSIDVPFLVGEAEPDEVCQLDWGASAGAGQGSGSGSAKNRPQQLAKEINDTSKSIAQLDKTMDKTFKEAEAVLNGAQPSTSRDAKDSKQSERSARSTEKKPAADATERSQRPETQGQRAPQNGSSHTVEQQRDSTHRNTSNGRSATRAKESGSTAAPKKERSTKHTAAAQRPASGTEEQQAGSANIQAMSYGAPMAGFWAGFLAGMGSLALLLGIGLFIAVQFFRPRNRD